MKLIECVPNISEGRDNNIINAITNKLKSNKQIHLLDVDPGYDTNRTVITFVGEPEHVINAAYELILQTYDLIDMSKHEGAHPRMGATDVCPLIPISNVSEKECLKFAKILAQKITDSLNIPIDYIIGTSIGAIGGGLYAIGYSPSEIEETIFQTDWDLIQSYIF